MPDQNTFGLPLENFWSEQCPPIIVGPFNAPVATSTVCLTFSGPALHFTFAPFPGYTTQLAAVTWKLKGNLDTPGSWTMPSPTTNIACTLGPGGVATCDLPFYSILQVDPSTPSETSWQACAQMETARPSIFIWILRTGQARRWVRRAFRPAVPLQVARSRTAAVPRGTRAFPTSRSPTAAPTATSTPASRPRPRRPRPS